MLTLLILTNVLNMCYECLELVIVISDYFKLNKKS